MINLFSSRQADRPLASRRGTSIGAWALLFAVVRAMRGYKPREAALLIQFKYHPILILYLLYYKLS